MMTVELKEFLNSKSTLTPGIAGGLTMLLTNTISVQFHTPLSWTGLAFSALFGILLMSQNSEPWLTRGVLYVLNTAVIFAMAVGAANTTAAAFQTTLPTPQFSPASKDKSQEIAAQQEQRSLLPHPSAPSKSINTEAAFQQMSKETRIETANASNKVETAEKAYIPGQKTKPVQAAFFRSWF